MPEATQLVRAEPDSRPGGSLNYSAATLEQRKSVFYSLALREKERHHTPDQLFQEHLWMGEIPEETGINFKNQINVF